MGPFHANKQPLEISVFFPTEMKFQNVSGKEISYFEVDISVPVSSDYAKDGRTLRWGTHPDSGKQENLLKPNEIATIAFDERLVKLYENAPTLSIQLLDVFFNNDASIKWRDGTWQERDKINPNVYHVIKEMPQLSLLRLWSTAMEKY